jgi:hypothetical protein
MKMTGRFRLTRWGGREIIYDILHYLELGIFLLNHTILSILPQNRRFGPTRVRPKMISPNILPHARLIPLEVEEMSKKITYMNKSPFQKIKISLSAIARRCSIHPQKLFGELLR